MENTIISVDGYQLETYKVHDTLSFTMAFDLNHGGLPANGGLRFCKYNNLKEQQDEALTLARHMSQKHRIYNTGFSGVKLVANGEVTEANKKLLLVEVAKVLNKYEGHIYTGCDLNMNDADMDFLYSLTPYVLNGIGSKINTSIATAYGVYGSLESVMESEVQTPNKTFMVHGVGKIGSVITKNLIAAGHEVYTFDAFSPAADVDGAINVSDNNEWYKIPCDYLILCSKSGVIDEHNMHDVQCRWIISSANSPFSSPAVSEVLKNRGVRWIPDVISNAGAVICDSLEYVDPENYKRAEPEKTYQFIAESKACKTKKLLNISREFRVMPNEALCIFLSIAANQSIHKAKLAS